MKKRRKNQKPLSQRQTVSRPVMYLFCATLPLIIASLLTLTASFFDAVRIDPHYACFVYAPMLEHVLMSLTLLVAGAVVLDCSVKEQQGST